MRSGLSGAEYCKQRGIDPKRLYYWQKRYKEQQSSGSFVSLSGSSQSQIKIQLKNGISIEVPSEFNERALKRVVEVLGC